MSLLTFLTHLADPRVEEPPSPGTVVLEAKAIAFVVDDDPGMRSLMTLSLEQVGYQVLAAPSGTEAIAMAQGVGRIDLAIVDLELHGLHGPDVVQSLHAMSGYMPVVYVSERASGLVGVADPVLRKPFLCGEWLTAVAGVVGVLPRDRAIAAA